MQFCQALFCSLIVLYLCRLLYSTRGAFIRVVIMKTEVLDIISTVVGWIYFVAWTVSFYPQIVENFRRKRSSSSCRIFLYISFHQFPISFFSVIGLNFDYLSLNIVGFTLYGCFNIGLYFIEPIQVFHVFFILINEL